MHRTQRTYNKKMFIITLLTYTFHRLHTTVKYLLSGTTRQKINNPNIQYRSYKTQSNDSKLITTKGNYIFLITQMSILTFLFFCLSC